MDSTAALRALLEAMPKCCTCPNIAVLMNEDRWWMCEECYVKVPCSAYPLAHDMRGAIYGAIAVLMEEDPTFAVS